ncbi:MAG TPA: DNA polymerase, partial [Planctomycetaceae bacterium]|nr:DNA polymerase [Planctomycetaceae bacterium]
MPTPTLFLIDTFSLLFQVFHAIPTMTSPQGLPVNAVYGFTRDLFNLLKTHHPTHWVCAMDSPGEGTRNAIYAEYKANRGEMPDDLRPQIALVTQIIEGFGVPTVQAAGWEADDVIATLTRQAAEQGWEVRIVTNDKDARQLLGPRVKLYNIRKNTWLDEADLKVDWGIRPEQVIDFQSLVGGSVDNVPGVPLIGPKKAAALLEQFGTLEGVLDNADKVAGDKLKANLTQFADIARVSRQLVTLNQHLPLEPDWDAMRVGRVDVARLSRLFHEFGFRRFIDEARSLPTDQKLAEPAARSEAMLNQEPARRWEIVDTDAKWAAFIEQLQQQREFGLDVAASSPSASQAEILGLAFCWEDGRSWYVPVGERPNVAVIAPRDEPHVTDASNESPTEPRQRQRSLFGDEETPNDADLVDARVSGTALAAGDWHGKIDTTTPVASAIPLTILESPDIFVSNHDLKFDLVLLRRAGISVSGLGVDPMIASYLLEAGARSHDLAALADRYCQQQLALKPGDSSSHAEIAAWATERVDFAWRLSRLLENELRRAGLWDLYWNLERPLIGVLAEMEATGIRVDVAELQRQSADIARRLGELIAEIHQLAGHEFNIDSPKQLAKVLFDELSLPVLKKIKTGPSTDQ